MNIENLRNLLEEVKAGKLELELAIERLRDLPYEDLGFAMVDHHRQLRKGFPEVILCKGKTIEQIVAISQRILSKGSNLLATRASYEVYKALQPIEPTVRYNELGRIISVVQTPPEMREGILVVTAGTSDIPVAEEALETAQIMGNQVERLYDVGVAGLHRLLGNREKLFKARVIIVVAGMEGALASVVGGLVDKPVIGVPTSIGYGASFGGVAALLSMLNSCASGVTVVNIDNGFGAGYIAALINKLG
ncbi:nickel pincer cofactor biosynthesis protein LarB [Candidatus Poribacteria bacterium]|nr:nickel pincer cofactor biosynthesis protein LarB [Candidatus Poribacteria bacterium]